MMASDLEELPCQVPSVYLVARLQGIGLTFYPGPPATSKIFSFIVIDLATKVSSSPMKAP